jgi:hypothetical protein
MLTELRNTLIVYILVVPAQQLMRVFEVLLYRFIVVGVYIETSVNYTYCITKLRTRKYQFMVIVCVVTQLVG